MRRIGVRLACVLAVLGGAGDAAGELSGRIVVAREAVVAGDVVRLADVATLEGERTRALGGMVLGAAPGAGESRTLDGVELLQALRRESGGLEGITYRIPPLVRVRRATQEIGEPAVRRILEEFLAEALGAAARDAVVRSLELPGPIRLPVGAYRARVIAPPGVPLLGRVRLQVEFLMDDRPVSTVWVTAEIGLYAPVVVARRPVARGEVLGAADLSVERRDLAQAPRDVVTDAEAVGGLVARAAIAPHTPIRRDQVAAPAAVHRGDVVLLVAERGGLRITLPGEAREDAGAGQQVRVTNRLSRKDLVGRVVDARTVAVNF